MRHALILLSLALASGAGADDIRSLGDEFDDPSSLADWSRVHLVEQWNADQLETYDIGATEAGRLTMTPHTSVWYEDYRGPFSFKEIDGDFVLTASVRVTGRDGVSVPASQYSLAGVFIRGPRDVTPATWTPGGENYLFLSLGHGASSPPQWEWEIKTTENGASNLILSPAPTNEATLQIARIGAAVLMLRRAAGEDWVVHGRYHRADLPATLQAGLVTYTDWEKGSQFDPYTHNGAVLSPPLAPGVVDPDPGTPFAPDLIASWDYARFARPQVPVALQGVNLADPAQASDAAIIAFLGDVVDHPFCPGDATGDQAVDFDDLNVALANWGATVSPGTNGDVTADGVVDFADLNQILSAWGVGC